MLSVRAGRCALLLALATCACADSWRWPDADQRSAASVRIDSKVRFVDAPATRNNGKRSGRDDVQSDELPFQEPSDTTGFYNRPPGSGRYPVRVEQAQDKQAYYDGRNRNPEYETGGTLDSLQYCKCVSTPNCKVQTDYANACGANQYLCCFKPTEKNQQLQSEFFNEIDDERPMLYPNQNNIVGPFPPPSHTNNGVFGAGHGDFFPAAIDRGQRPAVLVGPEGPTGIVGPSDKKVLVGPGGPTGIVGPGKQILVGPQGPTGIIGPVNEHRDQNGRPNGPNSDIGHSESAQRGVLVGPNGPTGIIGPAYNRPVLVGPGGPTGVIGSRRQGVLVGPGGPTGIIGPSGYNRPSQRPGILVGPGGPTGIIGPGRQVLVGPGGPTGQIGPRNYFGN